MTSEPIAVSRSHPAIEAHGLHKRFGEVTAVDGVDLEVAPGRVLGLLGPNGAGKTTVARILTTLVRPDEGTARVCGYDVVREAHQVRQLIGVTGQFATVDQDLTGSENLVLMGRLLAMPRAQAKARGAELIEQAGLGDAANRLVKTYSGGMRRRLDLVASLIHRPAVVFLDEPTTGLDPARRADTWAMVRDLSRAGTAVLLTTQYLEEADHLADDIVVIDAGRVIAGGTPDSLKRQLGRQTIDLQVASADQLAQAIEVVEGVTGLRAVVDTPTRRISCPVADHGALPGIVRGLDQAAIDIDELALRLPSLDDVFLTLTGTLPTSAAPELEANAHRHTDYSEGAEHDD